MSCQIEAGIAASTLGRPAVRVRAGVMTSRSRPSRSRPAPIIQTRFPQPLSILYPPLLPRLLVKLPLRTMLALRMSSRAIVSSSDLAQADRSKRVLMLLKGHLVSSSTYRSFIRNRHRLANKQPGARHVLSSRVASVLHAILPGWRSSAPRNRLLFVQQPGKQS